MSGILSFTKLISIMEKSDKNKKLFKEVGKDSLLNIFNEGITKKKLNAKDTVENRIKFQKIMLKGIKSRVVVPDQPIARGIIKQIEKNKTPYGIQVR
jgi:hypothetical protein